MKNIKKLTAIVFFLIISQSTIVNNQLKAQNVGINQPNPDPSALLELTSDSMGLLIPRMTTDQRNAIDVSVSPNSVMIFNTTTKCFEFYYDGSWYELGCATETFTCGTSTVNDIDGNTYNTVLIDTQCWLKENMRTTKYPDNTIITKGPSAHGDPGWTADLSYYSCPPNTTNDGEDSAAAATLGMLYQWSAAMHGSTTEGAQGICPAGWHVSTDAEWKTLEGFVGMTVAQQDLTGWRGTNEGSKMADHLADQNWTAGALTGDTGFNTSGFDLGPSGGRHPDGNYYLRGINTSMWTSTESGANAWHRVMSYTLTQVYRGTYDKAGGFPVRCVKD